MRAQAIAPTPRDRVGLVLLVVVTAAWGSTFLLVKDVTRSMPTMSFLAWRFWIASAVLVIVRPKCLLRISRATLIRGSMLGLVLAGGYILQTLGLRYTSAALSGFLTGLCVVMTPVLAWPILGLRAQPATVVAVVVAIVGVGVISLNGIAFGLGEALSVACAACYALQIVGLGAWSSGEDIYALALFQLITVAICCTIGSALGGIEAPHGGLAWFAVLSTAVVATSIAFVVQAWAQSFISPTRAAIIFTLEPVFAAFVAWLGGEHLSKEVIIGGALVVMAMVISEHGLGRPRRAT